MDLLNQRNGQSLGLYRSNVASACRSTATTPTTTAAAAATTATAVATTRATTTEVGVGADVAHRGLQGVGLLGALGLGTAVTAMILVGATEAGGDALGALDEALVEGLLQRVGDGADVVEIVVRIAGALRRLARQLGALMVALLALATRALAALTALTTLAELGATLLRTTTLAATAVPAIAPVPALLALAPLTLLATLTGLLPIGTLPCTLSCTLP